MLTPSITFGSSATSCAEALVKQLRTQAARAIGPTEGRSTSARLLLEGMDAGELIVTKAVMAWVAGLWDQLVDLQVMQRAWRHAIACNLADHRHIRGSVSGAAAYLQCVARLGWTTPSVNSVKTRSGLILFFGRGPAPEGAYSADPALIKKFVSDDYEHQAMTKSSVGKDLADLSGLRGFPWDEQQAVGALHAIGDPQDEHQPRLDAMASAQASEERRRAADLWRRGRFEHGDDGPVPWMWPIRAAMRAARRTGLHSVAASIRSLAEGGWPSQFRLRCHSHASHAWCSCRQAIGTIRHKLGQCSLSEEQRKEHCPEWLTRSCGREPWNPLFSRGVPARPREVPIPKDEQWTETQHSNTRCVTTGDVYTDGSAVGAFWRATRGGWSVVTLSAEGKWVWTKFGTMGGPNVSSYRAELRALLEALRHAETPLTIHTDSQPVIDGCARGRKWCVSSKATDADLWREVWDLLEEVRMKGQVHIVKVKAHTGWDELLRRKISPKDQYGNWLADAAAKAGAARSEKQAPAAPFHAQVKKALAWLKWVGRYSTEWINDTEYNPVPKAVSRVSNDPADGCNFGGAHLKHELWTVGNRVACRRCLATQRGGEEELVATTGRCEGSAAGRAAAQATGNLKYVWARFATTRRDLLSRGGRRLTHGRPPRWMIDRGGLAQVASSPQHLDELRRYLAGGEDHGRAPPWMAPPPWMPAALAQPWETGEGDMSAEIGCYREALEERDARHTVAFRGPLAYCNKCPCFAERRVGSRFKGACVLSAGRAAAAFSYRLARIRDGKHPIIGEAIGDL